LSRSSISLGSVAAHDIVIGAITEGILSLTGLSVSFDFSREHSSLEPEAEETEHDGGTNVDVDGPLSGSEATGVHGDTEEEEANTGAGHESGSQSGLEASTEPEASNESNDASDEEDLAISGSVHGGDESLNTHDGSPATKESGGPLLLELAEEVGGNDTDKDTNNGDDDEADGGDGRGGHHVVANTESDAEGSHEDKETEHVVDDLGASEGEGNTDNDEDATKEVAELAERGNDTVEGDEVASVLRVDGDSLFAGNSLTPGGALLELALVDSNFLLAAADHTEGELLGGVVLANLVRCVGEGEAVDLLRGSVLKTGDAGTVEAVFDLAVLRDVVDVTAIELLGITAHLALFISI